MTRSEYIKRVTEKLHENNVRKRIHGMKHVLHVSDDDGNTKDFIVRKKETGVLFTMEDMDAVIDACTEVIKDALKHGESIYFRGFGTIGLRYYKGRDVKAPNSEEWSRIRDRYVPKFSCGKDLRLCAKIYELSLGDSSEPQNFTNDFEEDEE